MPKAKEARSVSEWMTTSPLTLQRLHAVLGADAAVRGVAAAGGSDDAGTFFGFVCASIARL